MDKVIEGLKEKIKINLKVIYPYEMQINPCINCKKCQKEKNCTFNDDMNDLYLEFDETDIILVSTPVFFNGVPAQFKAMIDRCQLIWSSKYILEDSIIDRDKKRIGYLLATGGAPEYKDQFCGVQKVMEMFFKAVNAEFKGKQVVANIDKKPVTERKNILKESYNIGLRIAEEEF